MRIRTLTLLLVVLLALSGSTAALAGDSKASSGKRGATELTLYALETSAVFITREGVVIEEEPQEDALPSPGDRFVGVEEVYSDEDLTDRVGRNDIECVITEATGDSEETFEIDLLCHGVLRLDDQGSLAWQGATTFSAETETATDEPFVTVAITGGTDDLLGASGEVSIFDTTEDPEDDATSRYEVTLLLPKRR